MVTGKFNLPTHWIIYPYDNNGFVFFTFHASTPHSKAKFTTAEYIRKGLSFNSVMLDITSSKNGLSVIL